MNFEYIKTFLKKGHKASRIFWRTQTIGCIEKNDNIYLFDRISGTLKRKKMWSAPLLYNKIEDWCIAIPFKEEHMFQLGFSDLIIEEIYKIDNYGKGVKLTKNKTYWIVESSYIDKIYYLHEFINFCFLNDIELKIDINTECLLDLKYNKLKLVNKPNIIEWVEPNWHWKNIKKLNKEV